MNAENQADASIQQLTSANGKPSRDKKGSRVLAIFIGFVIDVGGTMILGILFTFIYSLVMAFNGVPAEQIMSSLKAMDKSSQITGLFLFHATVGGLLSILGGYVCARIVNYSEYKYAALLAVISACYAWMIVIGAGSPIFRSVFLTFLSFGCTMLGAHVHVKKKNKEILIGSQRSAKAI